MPLVRPGDKPVASKDAAIQVLHGVPDAAVDLYVDGRAIATGFTAGTIAGPIDLPAGDYDVALFAAAAAGAPALASDRTDKALVAQSVAVGNEPTSLVAHLNETGAVTLSAFPEKLSLIGPGQSRVMLRHLMATGPVAVSVNGKTIGTVAPGNEIATEVEAGPALIEFVGADGQVLTTANVKVADGELAALSAIGSPKDKSAEVVIQRYSGLSTAPVNVPTGDSGLLGTDSDQFGVRLVYGLMIALALSGGFVAFRRQRSWS